MTLMEEFKIWEWNIGYDVFDYGGNGSLWDDINSLLKLIGSIYPE